MKRGHWLNNCSQSGFVGILTWLSISIFACKTLAQSSNIVPDNTLGAESSQVTPNYEGEAIEVITGGATRGINLFHSFREFNVSEGRGAYFLSPNADIQNILSRVTGSNKSEILGTLGTFGESQPNLFLINPNGIVFGENASLDVQGSFAATTANSVQFGSQGIFSATNPQQPSQLLTINPSAFLFNQINQNAAIQNNAIAPAGNDPAGSDIFGLRVPDGKSLLLLGGNVSFDGGRLYANGGRIELGGLAEPGNVNLAVNGNNLSLNFLENFARADISIKNQAGAVVNGVNGGDIAINTQNLEISENSGLFAGILFGLGTPSSQAGNIDINAAGTVNLTNNSFLYNTLQRTATGKAGDININAGSVNLESGSILSVSTFGKGNAGNIFITTVDGVSLFGAGTVIFNNVARGAVGNGGNIDIKAGSLTLSNRAQIEASVLPNDGNQVAGNGNAGNVNIDVRGQVSLIGVKDELSLDDNTSIFNTLGDEAIGKGGDINIKANSVLMTDEAQLGTTTFGKGDAGNISIQALDAVFLNSANISSSIDSGGVGNGGTISIQSGTLTLVNSAQLQTSVSSAFDTLPPGQGNAGQINIDVKDKVIISGARESFRSGFRSLVEEGAIGNGGDINIKTGSLSVINGAAINASSNGQGNAGNVIIDAREGVAFDGFSDDSQFASAAFSRVGSNSQGNGGDIRINADSISLSNGAVLQTSSEGLGDAGSIFLRARDSVSLLDDARIFSFLGIESVGKGGNIDINAASVSFRDNASLVASSYGQGSAGDVIINAKENILFDRSNAFSTVEPGGIGNGGKIAIASENLTLNNGSRLETLVRGGFDDVPSGRGNAGSINVDVRDTVTISGVENDSRSGFRSLADFGTVGNGGSINIKTGSFIASDGAEIIASIFGKGSAGNILIDARENVQFNGASSFSTVGFQGDGNGGDINLKAGSLFFTNGAEISTATFGIGSAGNVILNARDTVLFDKANVFTSVDVNGRGNAGDIRINTDSLSIINGAILTSNTSGQGSAGNVLIDATKNVFLDNKSAASAIVQKGAVGNGGNININTNLLSVTNGSELQTNTSGRGNAGNLIINARDRVSFVDTSGAFSRVEKEGVGKGGDIRINTNSFSVINGAQLTTSTLGQGNAGNIQIQASENVNIAGSSTIDGFSSGLFSTTFASSTGKGGNITIDTNVFRVSNGAFLDARTRNDGRGGDITVNGNLVEALNGGQLLTTTSGSGRAGKITVNASDRVLLNGNDATFNQRLDNFPEAVTNKDAGATSGFFVLSTGSAIAGDIEVNSPKVTLDNSGRFIAESASGDGGNINLNISDLLLMRRGSQISTSAGTAQQGGDGGNIDINSRFIVAVPEENSDISANAFTGAGGKVQITSRGVFGIEARSQVSDRSDITASSERGVQGVTTINAPDNSGIQNSLNQLSENPIDADALIASSCIARRNSPQSSTFFITGKGGLPERPGEAPISAFSTGTMQNVPKDGESAKPRPWKIGDPIVEPTGVYTLANGKRVLSRECD